MQEIELKGINEIIYYDVICGLPVYVYKNEKVRGTLASLNVKYGSIHQEFKVDNKSYKVPSGIAHFLEHLNFYENEKETATDFYSKYGSEVNAYTTFLYTSYYVYTTNHYLENVEHLLDFVLTPYFNKKMLNKERSIIIEEARADEDLPESNLYFTHYKNLFNKYKYKEQITGKVEDIKKITLDDIMLVYNTFYHPENMFLIVSGNVNQYEIMKMVEENLNKKNFPMYIKPKLKKVKELTKVNAEYTEIYGNVEKAKVKISLKQPLNNFKEFDLVYLLMIMSLIMISNFGTTSDLKEYLMEEELINYLNTGVNLMGDYIILTVSLETDYPNEVIDKIKQAFNSLDITQDNLQRKMNSTLANLILNFDDINDVNDNILSNVLNYNKVIDNIKEIISNMKLEDVKKVIKLINPNEMAITVLKSNE